MNKKFYIILILLFISSFGTKVVFASPVTFSNDTTLALSSPAINLTALSGSVADSLTVNAGTVVVSMSATTGGTFVLTSPQSLTVGTSGSGGTVLQTCSSGTETETITQSSSSETFTFTPTGSACSGIPGAPTIGTATAGNAQATITFTAPVSNGGSSILYYMAVSNPGSITSATTSATSVIVTGLTNGTPYTFTITATNANGTSTPSSSSNSISPTTGIPILSSISSGSPGATSATITWVTDLSSDSQVEYGLSSTYTASSTLDSTLTTSHSVSLSGLSQATTYHYRVLSSNGVTTASSDNTFTTSTQSSGGSSGGGVGGNGPIAITGGGSKAVQNSTLPIQSVINIPPANTSLFASGNRSLYLNVKGADVTLLQEFLASKGYISQKNVTGFFGPLTEKAVKQFQIDTKIISLSKGTRAGYGVVGPTTQSIINSLVSGLVAEVSVPVSVSKASLFTRNLTIGSVGEDVKRLQIFLNTNGFPIAKSGVGSAGNETTLFGEISAICWYLACFGIFWTADSRIYCEIGNISLKNIIH